MITLAMDTSASVGSVAILRDGKPLAETSLYRPAESRSRSTAVSSQLVPAVQRLFAENDLRLADTDLLAVGLGPGSFTGIRVAIATARGYAFALGKPLVGVNSMDAVALGSKERIPPAYSNLAVLVDAGRREMYCAVYSVLEGRFFKVNDAALLTLAEMRRRFLVPTFFAGPEIGLWRNELQQVLGRLALVDSVDHPPLARFIGSLAEEKFREQQAGDPELEPIYLRPAAGK